MKARPQLWWMLSLAGIAYAIYAVGVGAPYFADDFQFVFAEPQTKLFHFFGHENPTNPLYRPLQASFLAAVQTAVGLNTAPIQLVQIGFHALLAILIFQAMPRLGFSIVQARVASLWMVVSQANVHPVISNDTLSQVTGTLFGCLSIWWLYCYCYEKQEKAGSGRYYVLSLAALALSLWSKESSVSYVMILAAVVLLERFRAVGLRAALPHTIMRLVPFALLSLAYLAIRGVVVSAQPHFGDTGYSFRLGSNVLVNLVLFAFGAIVPGSSVSLGLAAKRADYLPVGLAVVGALVLLTLVAYGWRHAEPRMRPLLWAFLAFAVLSMFPMILMNHVSELYVYNSMPFIVVVGGAGLGRLFSVWRSDRLLTLALTAVCLLAAVSHSLAVVQKAGMLKSHGLRATVLLDQVVPFARQLPRGGEVDSPQPSGV